MYTVLREYIRYNSPGAKSKLLRWPEETCKLGRLASSATWRMAAASCAMAGPCKPSPQQLGQAEGKQKPPLTKGGTQHRGVSARCQARSQRMQPAWPLLHRGVSCQQDGFKDTMCALEDKAAKVGIISQHPYLFRASKDQGIAPYLQLSLLTDLNHTW